MVGSIGTYIQISKAQLQSEKHNYKTIYAKASTNKNRQRRAAQDGDFQPYQELVDKFNTMFLQNVRKYRRLTVDAAGTLSGEMFFADDAKRRGLIDEVGTFSQAIKLLRQKINQRAAVKRPAARATAPAKPAPPVSPNADQPWLNNPANQRAARRLKG
jgi:ClpP class serine protease